MTGPRVTLAVLLVALALLPVACTHDSSVRDVGDSREVLSGSMFEGLVGNGLKLIDRGDFGLGAAAVVPGPDGLRAVRARYPAGSASHAAGGPEGGLQAYFALPGGPVDTLQLTYQVRFPAGFDFVKGGKLPGLFGGTVNNGQHIPDGENGFSTRYMWRQNGAGEVYAYLPTSVAHGTSFGRGCWTFPTGQWVTVRQSIVLNTPGRADGRIDVWFDGRPVLSVTGVAFRTTGSLRIEGLFFSTFFGGDSDDYRTPVDQYADFADFRIISAPALPPSAGSVAPPTCRRIS